MAPNRGSVSEQKQKRSNRILLIIGLVLLMMFLLALCQMKDERVRVDAPVSATGGVLEGNLNDFPTTEEEAPTFGDGSAQLVVSPDKVEMDKVVLGEPDEFPITLTAKNAPILLGDIKLKIEKEDNFQLDLKDCTKDSVLAVDKSCTLMVIWTAQKVRTIHNTLDILWREDSPRVLRDEKTSVAMSAHSTDSKDCTCCKCDEKNNPDIPREAAKPNGDSVKTNPDGTVDTSEGPKKPSPEGYVETKDGPIFVEPEMIPLSLKNELLGSVKENHDVVDFEGKKIGHLLGDRTIINEKFEILGKAIYHTPAMTEKGEVIAKMSVDMNQKKVYMVDAKKKVVGVPRVDGQVMDLDGKFIAYLAPWGMVMDFQGKILGGIRPDGKIIDSQNKVAGYMRPMGLALSKTGGLIGGIVPRGVVVGASCKAYGVVAMNGQVKDSFDQNAGHVLLDKTVVNGQMNEIGSVVRQGLVIDSKGKPVGFVNSAGKAVNANGELIGCINPDGSVFAKDKFVGAVMPQGRVIREACGQVGSVYPDGQALDDDLKVVGHVYPNGDILDESFKYLGMVAPTGTAIVPDCQLLGLISPKGIVVSLEGFQVGCISKNKEVLNTQGEVIGQVTPTGLLMDDQNKVIGRVGLDGQIYDAQGQVLGCVNSTKKIMPPVLRNKGVVIDENGRSTGWSFVGGKVFDASSTWIGDVYSNGYVIGNKKQLVGFVPVSGTVFSDKGEILGKYDQMSGLATRQNGDILGRVLPGRTVVNEMGTEILGTLIEEGTTFVDFNGMIVGSLQSDGTLLNQNQPVDVKIYANGLVREQDGKLIGGAIRSGSVLNTAGKFVGYAQSNSEVVNEKAQKIGHVLPNGLAVSNEGNVLGSVFPEISVPVSEMGGLGSVMPQLSGANDSVSYQAQVNDTKGNLVGLVAAGGAVLGSDNAIKGNLVALNVFINDQGHLLGWTNFSGGLNNPEGRFFATILPSGIAVSSAQEYLGRVVPHAIAVDTMGKFLGAVSSRGEILSLKGEKLARVSGSTFLYDDQGILVGRLLVPGIALGNDGKVIGWTRLDGQIEDGKKTIGTVGLDGHVFDENGQMVGMYLPLGQTSFSDNGKSVGLINESGELQDASGVVVGQVHTFPYGRLTNGTLSRFVDSGTFAAHMNNAKALGTLSSAGQVIPLGKTKIEGQTQTNTLVADNTAQVIGGIIPTGLATATTLGSLGTPRLTGQILSDRKISANISGNSIVYSTSGEVLGGLYAPSVIIDKKGAFAGATSGTSGVFLKGKQIGHKLAFKSALAPDSNWIGNTMPSGVVVDEDANHLGMITLDGSVIKNEGSFIGQILPDGTMAQVAQKGILNTMPYGGHTVPQGFAFGYYTKKSLGRTTSMADIVNANNQKLFRILDTGHVLGKEHPLEGLILPYISAVGFDGEVLGSLASTGEVVSYQGEVVGPIANNGAIKGDHQFKNKGVLVPEPLIVNNCKVVGQTAYDGRVINGQGSVVGRIRHDLWAIDSQEQVIGKVAQDCPIMSEKGEYLGRTMPDNTVVDINGVEIACLQNDGKIITKDGMEMNAGCVPPAPIFNAEGIMIGRGTRTGLGKGPDNQPLGKLYGDGTLHAPDGTLLGRATHPTEELILDPTGKLKYTLELGGGMRDPLGNSMGMFDPKTGLTYTPNGQECSSMIYVPGVGCLQGCDLIGPDGNKVASIQSDGQMLDPDGNLYGSLLPNGEIYDTQNHFKAKFSGIDVNFKQCGLPEAGSSLGTRKVKWGDNVWNVDSDSSVLDDEGNIIGIWKDGRLFDLMGKPLPTPENERPRPPEPKGITVDPEQTDAILEIMKRKRADMRKSLGNGTLLIPSKELQARGKPKKDKDWGLDKSVSTWPVDMSHVILQGKAIPAVLDRPIDSRYPTSPALAIVESNVYAEEGRNILIPAGSRLIGSFGGGAGENGVAKIDIQWSRLIRPDGSAFNLGGSPSGDTMGRGGIAAFLDKQLWNKYGNPFLQTLATNFMIDMETGNEEVGASSASTGNISEKAKARQEKRDNWMDLSDEIMDKLIAEAENQPPVVYVPRGTRFVIFPQTDLWLRSVEDDEEEANEKFGERPTQAQRPSTMEPSKVRNDRKNGTTSTKEETKKNDKKNATPEPLYNGEEEMPADIEDRVADPSTKNGEVQALQ